MSDEFKRMQAAESFRREALDYMRDLITAYNTQGVNLEVSYQEQQRWALQAEASTNTPGENRILQAWLSVICQNRVTAGDRLAQACHTTTKLLQDTALKYGLDSSLASNYQPAMLCLNTEYFSKDETLRQCFETEWARQGSLADYSVFCSMQSEQ